MAIRMSQTWEMPSTLVHCGVNSVMPWMTSTGPLPVAMVKMRRPNSSNGWMRIGWPTLLIDGPLRNTRWRMANFSSSCRFSSWRTSRTCRWEKKSAASCRRERRSVAAGCLRRENARGRRPGWQPSPACLAARGHPSARPPCPRPSWPRRRKSHRPAVPPSKGKDVDGPCIACSNSGVWPTQFMAGKRSFIVYAGTNRLSQGLALTVRPA